MGVLTVQRAGRPLHFVWNIVMAQVKINRRREWRNKGREWVVFFVVGGGACVCVGGERAVFFLGGTSP